MRLLWLKTDLLHPVDAGSKIRTYNILRELKRRHRIVYITLEDGTGTSQAYESAEEYCHRLIPVPHRISQKFSSAFYREVAGNALSDLPYAIQRYRSQAFAEAVRRAVTAERIEVTVCDFLHPSINVPATLSCPTVLFQHNVEAMILRRHYETQSHPLIRAYFRSQWRRMRKYEREACRRFDEVIAVSEDDCRAMASDYGLAQVTHIPTGVDTDYFRPAGRAPRESAHLVFTGAMDWLPNDDAMCFFVNDILPIVRRAVPEVRLTIVGRNPLPRVVALPEQDSHIVVTGRVSDVRPYMERAAVYVVPIRIGGGTRLKIYEAMAMERPVVTTSIGAEGLPVKHGEDVLVADKPEEFAASIIALLKDQVFARQLGLRAAEIVRSRFGWKEAADRFTDVCQRAVSLRASRPTPLVGRA
ncbi:MAG TPA: glycosyltransferase [Nitrospira sp.]|nr:glycosyltransferase [Nitrospira sp.]